MRKLSLILTLTMLTGVLTACGSSEPFDPCKVQPTFQNAQGEWREHDDEPLDSDPCDAEDFNPDGTYKLTGKKPTPAKKPATRKSTRR